MPMTISRKPATIEAEATSFARWRAELGLTQRQAAARLQKSRRTIQTYESPDTKTGRPVTPSFAVRILMEMIASGRELPRPWPE